MFLFFVLWNGAIRTCRDSRVTSGRINQWIDRPMNFIFTSPPKKKNPKTKNLTKNNKTNKQTKWKGKKKWEKEEKKSSELLRGMCYRHRPVSISGLRDTNLFPHRQTLQLDQQNYWQIQKLKHIYVNFGPREWRTLDLEGREMESVESGRWWYL